MALARWQHYCCRGFCRPWNFEPSHRFAFGCGISMFPRNFVEFDKWMVISVGLAQSCLYFWSSPAGCLVQATCNVRVTDLFQLGCKKELFNLPACSDNQAEKGPRSVAIMHSSFGTCRVQVSRCRKLALYSRFWRPPSCLLLRFGLPSGTGPGRSECTACRALWILISSSERALVPTLSVDSSRTLT